MKIAILGAPGAGKSQFAQDLAKELGGPKLGPDEYLVLDNYVEELRDTTNLEYGYLGNHIDDLQVVFKRREWELHWATFERNTITCGTILDSTAHCFVRTEDPVYNSRELVVVQERLHTIASVFGLLYTDTWDYDYAFYLPYRGDDSISRLIDAALVELLRSYAPPVFSFKPEVPNDKKATSATQAINALETQQLPEASEFGVRSGDETGEDDGDSVEPVSDVPESGRDSDNA